MATPTIHVSVHPSKDETQPLIAEADHLPSCIQLKFWLGGLFGSSFQVFLADASQVQQVQQQLLAVADALGATLEPGQQEQRAA